MRNLFLICPTDNLELPIRDTFDGDAFFCTALGIHFEWDISAQLELWQLIDENQIEHLIFISSIRNVFYQQAFQNQKRENYSVDLSLAQSKKKITNGGLSSDGWLPNFHLLAAEHLENQQERLLSTEHLGKQLLNSQIEVDAYVFRPHEESFLSLEHAKLQGHLVGHISLN